MIAYGFENNKHYTLKQSYIGVRLLKKMKTGAYRRTARRCARAGLAQYIKR